MLSTFAGACGEDPDKPFFLYVAHTAAHWPMHALPKDIAKYKGRYDDGFAPIREARLKRLKETRLCLDLAMPSFR